MALLTAAMIDTSTTPTNLIYAVYTYGCPRVGDSSWQAAYTALGINAHTFRYVYYYDPVPLLPPASIGYTHVGQFIWISEDLSSCDNQGSTDSVDTCPDSSGILGWLATVGADASCLFVATPIFTAVCAGAAAASYADSGDYLVAVMCAIGDGILDDQNSCCLLDAGLGSLAVSAIEADFSVVTEYFGSLVAYHSIDKYVSEVKTACTPASA